MKFIISVGAVIWLTAQGAKNLATSLIVRHVDKTSSASRAKLYLLVSVLWQAVICICYLHVPVVSNTQVLVDKFTLIVEISTVNRKLLCNNSLYIIFKFITHYI
jgi:hypothetical protein